MKVTVKGIQDTFVKWNDTFTKIDSNPELDTHIYERKNADGKVLYYEVIKPQLIDGVRCYPSTTQWGYGRALTVRAAFKEDAWLYMNNGLQPINRDSSHKESSKIASNIKVDRLYHPRHKVA